MKLKDSKYIGLKIRTKRKELGISQEKLGEMIGVSYQQIQKYEKGINNLSPEKIQLMAEALRVSIGFFFDGEKKDFLVKVPFGDYPKLSSDEEDLIGYYRRLKNKRYQEFTIALFKSASEILGRRGNIKQS